MPLFRKVNQGTGLHPQPRPGAVDLQSDGKNLVEKMRSGAIQLLGRQVSACLCSEKEPQRP